MTFQEIEQKIKNALLRFYKEDSYLIDNNVHERSLTFRLGMYLQNEFPDYNVDCEYNKNYQTFQYNKLLSARCDKEPKFNCKECGDHRKCTVFPDIIIHQRGTDKNLLVIEAKCNANEQQIIEDCEKVQAYLDESTLHYQYGLFINFRDSLEQTLTELCWFPQTGDNYV